MDATVTKKGHKEILHELKKTVSLAPISQFNLPINWDNEPLEKGKYSLTINVKDKTGEKWQLKKDFTIEGKDESLNKKAVTMKKEKNHDNIYLYIVIIVCLVVIGTMLWYITKLRKKK